MYGMICWMPKQMELIKKYCFGSCGKILLRAVIDDQIGEIAICREKNCSCLDRQMADPIGMVSDGEEIYLRKLKEMPV
ncbi:MAG: hypothetical protein AUK24_05560 [Syntrophaceae bacterium CG2_30_49_12]|nr:hypothetical protein [Deltaproteobacteria bacterium]OIP89883.1 MAG: hypothetical protein AUK24_05560 [Syntrophaceae bacterium CG2_30_49_12]